MYVYVAGPYSAGSESANVRTAILIADLLMKKGHCPFLPHTTHLWELVSPKAYEDWLKWDFLWLRKCDALFRIPGESPGADREVALAAQLKIPIYRCLEDVPDEA